MGKMVCPTRRNEVTISQKSLRKSPRLGRPFLTNPRSAQVWKNAFEKKTTQSKVRKSESWNQIFEKHKTEILSDDVLPYKDPLENVK